MEKSSNNVSKVQQKKINELNREFEQIFSLIHKNSTDHFDKKFEKQLESITNRHFCKIIFHKIFKNFLIIIVCSALIYYVNYFNWNASAIGRIFMIKLLNIWDWKYLYNSNCLISVPEIMSKNNDYSATVDDDFSKYCETCENLENVPRILSDTSATTIQKKFLKRYRPVIIEPIIYQSSSINESITFLNKFMLIIDELDNGLCNIQSNLRAKNTGNLHELMAAFIEPDENTNNDDGAFLHFRNCKFASVKASRIFWQKPNYLLLHLNPFYSSWIMISKNYPFKRGKFLDVQGLILVNQISGKLEIILQPKASCNVDCMDLHMELNANEQLMFIADLWEFSYRPIDNDKDISITFITEFDWK